MPAPAFHNLHKLTNNTGQFPDDLVPASQVSFKYSYQIDLTDQLAFSTGTLLIVTIGATFLVADSAGTVLLEWAFSVTYEAGADIFGFVYAPTRQSVTVLQGTPAITGDPNGIVLQGDGGAGSAAGADIIFDAFESPAFGLAIPAGATVKITHHTAQYPSLDDILGLQVATRSGGGWASGFRHSADGQAHIIHSGGGGTYVVATGRERTLQSPAPLDWKPSGKVFLSRSPGRTTQVAAYASGSKTVCRVSYDDGGTWSMATLFDGYAPVGMCSRDGGQTFLLTKSGAAFLAYRYRDGTASVPVPVTLPAGTKLAEGTLLGESGGGMDFFWAGTGAATNHLHSDDELTWA